MRTVSYVKEGTRMPDAEEWLTIEECAKAIRVSGMTVRRLVARGELKAHRFGRQWRIHRRDWEGFVRATQSNSSSPE